MRRIDETPARPTRIAYGSDPSQFGDLYVPNGAGLRTVVMMIHGGFWRARYDLSLNAPLAHDLVQRGFVVWNIEYRRMGNGGGWPATLRDVAAAVDHLAVIGQDLGDGAALRQAQGTSNPPAQGTSNPPARGTSNPPARGTSNPPARGTWERHDVGRSVGATRVSGLDLTRVITLGHSAGGHLAAWLAGRARAGARFGPPVVDVAGVVSQAGVLDLEAARESRLGDGAVEAFMGNASTTAEWTAASPFRLLPFGTPIRCVHGDADDTVPIEQSREFVAAARAAGDDAELVVTNGDHFGVITPGDPGWAASLQAVEELAATS